MPDVGILNLQIHDDSAKAAKGLNRLATALDRVKKAVGGGLKLGPIASQITKLNKALEEAIPEGSLKNLERFAAAVEKINAAGGIKIGNIKKAAEFAELKGTAEQIREQIESGVESGFRTVQSHIQEVSGQIESGVESGFRTVQSHIQEVSGQIDGMNQKMIEFNQLVQQTALNTNGLEEQFSRLFKMWNEMRMASSLGPGEQTQRIADGLEEQFSHLFKMWNEMRMAFSLGPGEQQQRFGGGSVGLQYWNQWGDVKENAIVVQGTVTDAADETFDHINKRLTETQGFFLEAGKNASETAEDISSKVEEIIGYKRVWDESTRSFQTVGYTKDEWDARIEAVKAMQAAMDNSADNSRMDAAFQQTGEEVDGVRSRIQLLKEALIDVGRSGFAAMSDGFRSMRDGATRLIKPISDVFNKFKQIAKYRALRAVIKSITDGFREGLENYYRYSQAIGSSFAPAMDSAATSLLQMKNSIGAAVAPLIQSLIPYLQILVNWFISLVNYANQFIALLRGQSTWSRATQKSAKAFDDVEKSTKKASAAMKDLLADWDELNIIQSSTGGTSPTGTGTDAIKESVEMFEEVGEFSSKIKSMMSILEHGFGNLKNLAELIGIAILGWKISKAFEGFLGDIARITGGVAMVTIGLELSYGSGFSAGEKGYFDSTDLIGAIGGAIAGAIGGYMIAGVPGIAVGVGVSILASLTGYLAGLNDRNDKLKWGEKSLTPEDVKTIVDEQFKFDVDAEVNLMNTRIKNLKEARESLNQKIAAFQGSLKDARVKAYLSIDKSETAPSVIQASRDAQEAIAAVQRLIEENNAAITTTLQILPPSATGEDEDLLANLSVADTTLKDYFTDMGKRIAGYIYEGQKSGWANGEMEAAIALMESQNRIMENATQLQAENDLLTSAKVEAEKFKKSGVIDRDSAMQVLTEQERRLSEYVDTIKESYIREYENSLYLASLAQAAADEATRNGDTEKAAELEEAANTYTTTAERLLSEMDGKIEAKTKETKEAVAGYWEDLLGTVYGEDFERSVTEKTDLSMGLFNVFSGNRMDTASDLLGMESLEAELKKQIDSTQGDSDAIAIWLGNYFDNAIREIDPNGIIAKTMDLFGVRAVNMMTEDMKSSLLRNLAAYSGDSEWARVVFEKLFGVTEADAARYAPDVQPAFESAAEAILDAMNKSDWQNMTDEEFREFQLALADSFGADNVLDVLKNSGNFDIPDSEIVIPRTVTIEETVDTVVDDVEEGTEGAWNNLGGYFGEDSFTPPETQADVEIVPRLSDDMSVFGISTEGNWFGNLFDAIFNGTPLETDAVVHVRIDEDDEDLHIWDLMEPTGSERKPWTTANVRPGYSAGSAGSYSGGETQVAVMMDPEGQKQNVKDGIQTGTAGILDILRTLANTASQINQKDFTIQVTPSAAWGRNGRMSGEMYNAVTGEVGG